MAGRFAPSPTGRLHAGSLLVALGSFLFAKQKQQAWRVRIDDLDAPRHEAGALESILATLEAHGLTADGPIQYQSEHCEQHQRALDQLSEAQSLFYCRCSRKALRDHSIYPGTCRANRLPLEDSAIRINLRAEQKVSFTDLLQGTQQLSLNQDLGDFIVRRRDGIYAYHLATAVDDGDPGIDHVVRGADLLSSSAPQIYLMQELGLDVPEYLHLPLVTHADGSKLSKQTGATAARPEAALDNLKTCLGWLGIHVPRDHWRIESLLQFGVESLRVTDIPKTLPAGIGLDR